MLYDIIVVGAGPAGLTAGANAANRGLKTLILEGQAKPGGQPWNFYPKKTIIDFPGFPDGITGEELSERLYLQAINSKAEILMNEPMVDLDLKGDIKRIITKNNVFEAKKLILCTGLHNIPRSLDSLKDYHGGRVHYFIKDPDNFKGKNVLVIGGGDTAFDRANMIAGKSAKVTLIIREDMAKAKESSVERAEQAGVELMYSTNLVSLDDEEGTAELQYKDREHFNLKIDDVIVSVGFVSSLEVLNKAGLKKDSHGMIAVDQNMETSVKGVFAAGDIVGDVKLISVACAEGIIAAINTFNEIKKPYWLK